MLRCTETGCDKSYIGYTMRTFSKRLAEHFYQSKKSDSKGISRHSFESGHVFDFVRFLEKSSDYFRVKYCEGLYIKFNADNFNLCNKQAPKVIVDRSEKKILRPPWMLACFGVL